MRWSKWAIVATAAIFLAACENQQYGAKESVGTLLGAAGGAVAGAQFGKGTGRLAAVAAGTMLGAWLGNEVGKSLDRADKLAMQRSTQTALESTPSGQTVTWNNPDTGHEGTVTPRPAYKNDDGQYCREFQQTVTIGGKSQDAYGTACRQPDGTWKIVSQ